MYRELSNKLKADLAFFEKQPLLYLTGWMGLELKECTVHIRKSISDLKSATNIMSLVFDDLLELLESLSERINQAEKYPKIETEEKRSEAAVNTAEPESSIMDALFAYLDEE